MATNPQSNPQASADVDAALAARLERLSARRSSPASGNRPASTASTRPGPPPMAGAPVNSMHGTTSNKTTSIKTTSDRTGATKTRRRHAARGTRQAALVLSLVTTGGLSYAMALSPAPSQSVAAQPAVVVSSGSATAPSASTTSGQSAAPSTAPAPAAPIVVNGQPVSNRYGTVQVQATFAPNGTLTSVQTLQAPDGDRTSLRISNRAVPTLNSEALQVQSANVDTVSGATYTTHSYQQSLQSAIDASRASGLVPSA